MLYGTCVVTKIIKALCLQFTQLLFQAVPSTSTNLTANVSNPAPPSTESPSGTERAKRAPPPRPSTSHTSTLPAPPPTQDSEGSPGQKLGETEAKQDSRNNARAKTTGAEKVSSKSTVKTRVAPFPPPPRRRLEADKTKNPAEMSEGIKTGPEISQERVSSPPVPSPQPPQRRKKHKAVNASNEKGTVHKQEADHRPPQKPPTAEASVVPSSLSTATDEEVSRVSTAAMAADTSLNQHPHPPPPRKSQDSKEGKAPSGVTSPKKGKKHPASVARPPPPSRKQAADKNTQSMEEHAGAPQQLTATTSPPPSSEHLAVECENVLGETPQKAKSQSPVENSAGTDEGDRPRASLRSRPLAEQSASTDKPRAPSRPRPLSEQFANKDEGEKSRPPSRPRPPLARPPPPRAQPSAKQDGEGGEVSKPGAEKSQQRSPSPSTKPATGPAPGKGSGEQPHGKQVPDQRLAPTPRPRMASIEKREREQATTRGGNVSESSTLQPCVSSEDGKPPDKASEPVTQTLGKPVARPRVSSIGKVPTKAIKDSEPTIVTGEPHESEAGTVSREESERVEEGVEREGREKAAEDTSREVSPVPAARGGRKTSPVYDEPIPRVVSPRHPAPSEHPPTPDSSPPPTEVR